MSQVFLGLLKGCVFAHISGRGSGRTTRFAVGAERFGWLQSLPKPQPREGAGVDCCELFFNFWALGFSAGNLENFGWPKKSLAILKLLILWLCNSGVFFEVLVIWCLLHFVAIQTHGAVSRQSYSERPGFAGGILCGEDQRAKNNIATSRSCRLFQGSLGNTSVHESSGFLVQVYVWRWFSCCISIDQCLFNWVNTWNQPLDWILLMWTCCSTEPLQDATGSCWASIPLQWSESQSSHYVKAALDAGITGPWLIIQFWEQTIFSHQLSLQS